MSNSNEARYPGNKIHPSAVIHPDVKIGTGNRIGPYCIIGAHAEWKGHEKEGRVIIGNNNTITGLVTIDSGSEGTFTEIKSNCYLMKSVHLGHDVFLDFNVTVSCGAKIGGHTWIGKDANIGLNAVIHQKQIISMGCIIGMGAVVTKKLVFEPYKKYAGNPAKLIGENDGHPNYTIYMNDYGV